MPRPRKTSFQIGTNPNLVTWAESLGEALGRGVARGINTGISMVSSAFGGSLRTTGTATFPRRRGRPPKILTGGPVPADRRCKVDGCGREARSKGLCSAHYQAERRRLLAKA